MLNTFDHPWLLVAMAILLLPALFPIWRFFFDDFQMFKQEAAREYQQNRVLWLFGTPRIRVSFAQRVLGTVACYALFVAAVYQLVCRVVF